MLSQDLNKHAAAENPPAGAEEKPKGHPLPDVALGSPKGPDIAMAVKDQDPKANPDPGAKPEAAKPDPAKAAGKADSDPAKSDAGDKSGLTILWIILGCVAGAAVLIALGCCIYTMYCKGPKELRVLMVGLDASGKTTILNQLKRGEAGTTIPTDGFNTETIKHGDHIINIWDLGGRDNIRLLWHLYYMKLPPSGSINPATDAIIFVVDSNDRERINDEQGEENHAKKELHRLLAHNDLKDAIFLVYANKQDLPNAMSVQQITEKLGLNQIRDRPCYIQASSATTGDGLYEGLDWIIETLKK